jgi:type I restriction enzyme R subunit
METAPSTISSGLLPGCWTAITFLDLIRTFSLFSTNDKGDAIKIVGRCQQFRAVKLAADKSADVC